MDLIGLWLFLVLGCIVRVGASTRLELNCNIDEDPFVCLGVSCQTQHTALLIKLCPVSCGFCYQPNTVNCNQPDRTDVCVDDFCSVNDPNLTRNICPHFCGFCEGTTDHPASGTQKDSLECSDHLINGQRCQDIDGVCSSIYGKIACRRFCGECTPSSTSSSPDPSTVPANGTCMDNLGMGLACQQLPGVCHDPANIGQNVLCPKFCQICHEPTTTQAALECRDHVTHGVQCSSIDGVCQNLYGHIACKSFCDVCQGASPPSEEPSASGVCQDNLGFGLTCQELPGVCADHQNIGSVVLCPRFCAVCEDPTTTIEATSTTTITEATTATTAATTPTTEATTTTTEATTPTAEATTTTTEATTPTTEATTPTTEATTTTTEATTTTTEATTTTTEATTTTTTEATTTTTTTTTTELPTTSTIEPPTTTTTEPPTTPSTTTLLTSPQINTADMTSTTDVTSAVVVTSPPCEDLLKGPHSCENLANTLPTLCSDPNGRAACARFCGFCAASSTPDPILEMDNAQVVLSDITLQTSVCQDTAEKDVCRLPDFCQDRYSRAVCRKTCGFCQEGCHDNVNCTALLGDTGLFSSLSELCQDADTAAVCRFTCGCTE